MEEDLKIFNSKHIAKGWKPYAVHWLGAMRYAVLLIGTGLIVSVHAFIPFFLTNVGSLSVKRLHTEMSLCKCKPK